MIFEDPDELGYFTDHETMKASRSLGRSLAKTMPFPGSDITREELGFMEAAARAAHSDRLVAAEQYREAAGYGGLR